MMTRITALGAAMLALIAPGLSHAQDKVESQCKVEVDAEDLGEFNPRPQTVGFLKNVSAPGEVGIIRPTAEEWSPTPIEATLGMNLFPQDAIVTGASGTFVAVFEDKSVITGEPSTCIEIASYIGAEEPDSEFRLRLSEGLVSIEAGDIAEIRGDTMSVKVRDDTNLAVTGTVLVVRAQ